MVRKIDIEAVRQARENLARIKDENPGMRKMTLPDVANAIGVTTFSPEECADLLGVHAETLRRMIRSGRFPASKIGGNWRTSKADLERYYRENGGGTLFPDDAPDNPDS